MDQTISRTLIHVSKETHKEIWEALTERGEFLGFDKSFPCANLVIGSLAFTFARKEDMPETLGRDGNVAP